MTAGSGGDVRVPKLLIADDEEGVRSLVRMTLTNPGYEIVEAADGAEALRLALEHRPELIFLDVEMPELSGFEVCRRLRASDEVKGSTIVMLTAMTQERDLEEGRLAGADAYFTKPFSPFALLAKVEEILPTREASS